MLDAMSNIILHKKIRELNLLNHTAEMPNVIKKNIDNLLLDYVDKQAEIFMIPAFKDLLLTSKTRLEAMYTYAFYEIRDTSEIADTLSFVNDLLDNVNQTQNQTQTRMLNK